jgi:hypothetical protein
MDFQFGVAGITVDILDQSFNQAQKSDLIAATGERIHLGKNRSFLLCQTRLVEDRAGFGPAQTRTCQAVILRQPDQPGAERDGATAKFRTSQRSLVNCWKGLDQPPGGWGGHTNLHQGGLETHQQEKKKAAGGFPDSLLIKRISFLQKASAYDRGGCGRDPDKGL